MATTAPPVIALATFQRTLTIARAALDGSECLVLTARYGLRAMTPEQLDLLIEAIAIARHDLDALEAWPAGSALDGVRLQ
jgi:hypothetical protein